MKINIPVRLKNPWFWAGIVLVALNALNVSPDTFQSWGAVWACIVATVSNPFQLCTMLGAVLAIFVDPTTAGLTDSTTALTYKSPRKE